MISLLPVIEALTPKPAGFEGLWFRNVDGAAEYARLKREALPKPAAWVVRAGERVKHAGERTEDVIFVFDVVMAIENARTRFSGEIDEQLLGFRMAVKGLLLGLQIPGASGPVQFDGGAVLEYAETDLFWRDRYVFEATINNYLPDPPAFDGLFNSGVNP